MCHKFYLQGTYNQKWPIREACQSLTTHKMACNKCYKYYYKQRILETVINSGMWKAVRNYRGFYGGKNSKDNRFEN